jgi:hypothetical protein
VFLRAGDGNTITENYIHHLSWTGARGYGIQGIDSDDPSRISDLTIRGNRFEHIPADAIQLGSVLLARHRVPSWVGFPGVTWRRRSI